MRGHAFAYSSLGFWGQDGGESSSISLGEHLCRTTFLCVLRCLRASHRTIWDFSSLIVCHHPSAFLFLFPLCCCILSPTTPSLYLSSSSPADSSLLTFHFCWPSRISPLPSPLLPQKMSPKIKRYMYQMIHKDPQQLRFVD